MASFSRGRSPRPFDDTMDDDIDDKDDSKRKSRNLSEKKRRDQFNVLVNELANMVCPNTRKMDKSTVLKSTILFLKNHNETTVRSRVHEIQEDWKPSFLSNEEFTHLILEAVDGFIMVFSSSGRIYYVSESVISLLGYSPNELENTTIYNITYNEDQSHLYNVFLNPTNLIDKRNLKKEERVTFLCHIKRGGLDYQEDPIYELVQFVGYFRSDVEADDDNTVLGKKCTSISGLDNKIVFVGTGRLQTPQLIRELSVMDSTKPEFTSRHSLEWKFLFLDHRAPPIIGYMPFEVLGTSGYDYYHVDDLDNVVNCHESLMQKGEGTSCYYRFLTKGQQWIWLQTRFYITYNQWNSKPEFIVCTHYVVSYMEVMKELRKELDVESKTPPSTDVLVPVKQQQLQISTSPCQISLTQWSTKNAKGSKPIAASSSRLRYNDDGSDSSSISASMQSSPHSRLTHGSRSKALSVTNSTGSKTIPHIDTRQQPQQQPHQQHSLNVDTSCINFMQPTQYATVNLQPVVATTGFSNPNAPTLSTIPAHEMIHEQGIVMTSAQNQIQDELERKHEELQQSIVHQQEELRRVSEQLLIAKYGLLSPLLNAGIPYNATNICQQMNRCNTDTSNMQLSATTNVQGVNVLPIPITVPVPVVSTELFSHSLPLNPIPTGSGTRQSNASTLMQSQPPQHQAQEQQQGPTDQDSSAANLVPFQICSQQTDMLYTDIEPPPNQQQGSSQN